MDDDRRRDDGAGEAQQAAGPQNGVELAYGADFVVAASAVIEDALPQLLPRGQIVGPVVDDAVVHLELKPFLGSGVLPGAFRAVLINSQDGSREKGRPVAE